MSEIEFSLVIPTKERADTLRFALQACLQQNFTSYEIVVCDNCSSPATREVVESIGSPRVVYHRSTQPLCARDNWNLAYSLTRGRYVTYIGDDDALMPFAFSTLHEIFAREKMQAVRWDNAIYCWPNIARADFANHLQIPIAHQMQCIDGHAAIQDVLDGRSVATLLPNIYHGCISREILEAIRVKTGNVFESLYCDTYSSFAIAYQAKQYLSLSAPLSISGFSASSNNIAFNFLRSKHENTQKQRDENDAAGLRLHPRVPDLPSGFVCVVDSFLHAKGNLFPDSGIELDRRGMIERFIVAPPIDDIEEWPYVKAELKRSISDDTNLLAWFDDRIKGYIPKPTPRDNFRPEFEGIANERIYLDGRKYGISNIAGATSLAARLLCYSWVSISWLTGRNVRFADWIERIWAVRMKFMLNYLRKL